MTTLIILTILFYLLCAGAERLKSVSRSGPYDMNIEQLESCEDQGTNEMYFNTRINSAGGGKYIYNGYMFLNFTIDERFKMDADMQAWGNGGWRPRFFMLTIKGCQKLWNILGDFLTDFLKSTGIEDPKCPIPAGNHTAHDWRINLVIKSIPSLVYNKYRLVLQFYNGKTKVGCLKVYGEAVPKI